MPSRSSLRRLQTFCMYCSLRSGVLVAFGFVTLYYVVFALMLAVWLIWLAEWKRDKIDPLHQDGLNSWHVMAICAFVFSGLNMIVALCLLVAITKHSHHMLVPALMILFVTIAANLVYLAEKISLLSKVSPNTSDDNPVAELFQCIIYDVFFCVIMGYLWVIILSYYLQMVDKNLVSPGPEQSPSQQLKTVELKTVEVKK